MPPKRPAPPASRSQPVAGTAAKSAGKPTGAAKVFVEAKRFDPKRLVFEPMTTTKSGSSWIPAKYDGQRLLLHTGVVRCPFGASQYQDKTTPTSFSMQISIDDDNEHALAVGDVMKQVMDAIKAHLPTVIDISDHTVEYTDTCQQSNGDQYAPLARVTLPLFKGKFTTQIIKRGGEPVQFSLNNWHKVLPKETGVVVDGAIRFAGAYYFYDEETERARVGASWQWHSIRLAGDDELMTEERKAENAAVADALVAAAATATAASAARKPETKRKAEDAVANGNPQQQQKRAKSVHEDCEIVPDEAMVD